MAQKIQRQWRVATMFCDRPTGPFLAEPQPYSPTRHRWTGPDGRPQVRCGYEARDAEAAISWPPTSTPSIEPAGRSRRGSAAGSVVIRQARRGASTERSLACSCGLGRAPGSARREARDARG